MSVIEIVTGRGFLNRTREVTFSMARRKLLQRTLAVGASGILLASEVAATEPSGDLSNYPGIETALAQAAAPPPQGPSKTMPPAPRQWLATEPNVEGPFYRSGAPYPPYRVRLTPPYEPGKILFVKGRVFGLDTRRPLAKATVDVWQANEKGHYDNDDDNNPPAADFYHLRGRMETGPDGAYEYETIHPGAYYEAGLKSWRPSHIHYRVSCPGYLTVITQMYFDGDQYNGTDRFIRPSLIVPVLTHQSNKQDYEQCRFDIILAPKP